AIISYPGRGALIAIQFSKCEIGGCGNDESPLVIPAVDCAVTVQFFTMLCIVPEFRTSTTNTAIVSLPSFNGPATTDSTVPANCGDCERGAKIEKRVRATTKTPTDTKNSARRLLNHSRYLP